MEALAVLSKSAGIYDRWKLIKENYQLKWSTGNTDSFYIKYIDDMLNGKQQLSDMIAWLKSTCEQLPQEYSDALVFNTVTGLRPTEAFDSIKLLKSEPERYVRSKDYGASHALVLEHYKYPGVFIRQTKKAYISILTKEILEFARKLEPISWKALRGAINRRGLETHVKYCRKIHATYVKQSGIDAEVVDILQGRVARSVFARFYYRPDFDLAKLTKIVSNLYELVQK
jgi:hypothetical protein